MLEVKKSSALIQKVIKESGFSPVYQLVLSANQHTSIPAKKVLSLSDYFHHYIPGHINIYHNTEYLIGRLTEKSIEFLLSAFCKQRSLYNQPAMIHLHYITSSNHGYFVHQQMILEKVILTND